MVTNKDMDKKVGAVLENSRKRSGITQEKLAERVNISVAYYRDIAHGKSRPNWVTWAEICRELGIDPKYLIDTYVKPKHDKTNEKMDLNL